MWTIRQANVGDTEALTALRLRFLQEIGYGGDDVSDAVREYFEHSVPTGEFVAWLAQRSGQIVGTSGLVFVRKPPHGRNLTGREAHVMNMYTIPQYRRQGVATALLESIRRFVVDAGVTCIRLNTTVGATRVYHALGFRSDTSEMVLQLDSD